MTSESECSSDGDDGANAGELVPHAGLQREVFADLHAGNVGLDRLEFAAEFGRSVRLEVVHVHVRRAAGQVNHDGGLWPRRCGLMAGVVAWALQAQHVGEGQAGAERADLEEIAAVNAVAEVLFGSQEVKHDAFPLECEKCVSSPILVILLGISIQGNLIIKKITCNMQLFLISTNSTK